MLNFNESLSVKIWGTRAFDNSGEKKRDTVFRICWADFISGTD